MVRQYQAGTLLGRAMDRLQMAEKRRLDSFVYRVGDFVAAMVAWTLFFLYRKHLEGASLDVSILQDANFWLGVLLIPCGWVVFYAIFDPYLDIYRLSRVATLARTFFLSFLGVTFLFFALLLDDIVSDYRTYYQAFFSLFFLHFTLTAAVRMVLLTRASRRLKAGKITYNTLLIGGNEKALELYEEINGREKKLGYFFVGFIDANGKGDNVLEAHLPRLGSIEEINGCIDEYGIEEVIIAIETSAHSRLQEILGMLFDVGNRILVKIIPDMYDIILGTVKMNHLYGAVLIEIKQDLMPRWQRLFKRLIDLVVSIVILIVCSPLYAYIALRVKLSSPGPILFSQERIGQHGQPFRIFKFRSMMLGAEDGGPQLSYDGDDRCTPWGSTMRKWRLDELPQFWNVLKGEMSIVGPRPERKFYIERIMQQAPHYRHLLKVRPGITSWGQVKFGYASSVEQMIQRLKFDILYIENMSLALDFKIMFYTMLVLLQGKGK